MPKTTAPPPKPQTQRNPQNPYRLGLATGILLVALTLLTLALLRT